MVVVNVVIEHTDDDAKENKAGIHLECNLLKREDADEIEWQLAKAMEATILAVSKLAASDILKEEHID